MAWLYLPGAEVSNSDSPLLSENITDQSPTLKGKQRPLRSWQLTWNAGGWIRLLSGMTLKPSQAQLSAHSWIESTLLQQDSLASRGQSPVNEKEPMTNGGSGPSSSDWFARYDPETSSWRTSQVSFMEELNTFSETWPRSGSMRNGQVFERQTLAHRTVGNASSSSRDWMTPKADELSSSRWTTGRPIEKSTHLSTQVVNTEWQTPAAFQGKYRRQVGQTERAELLLPGQAENWATPTARDYKDGSNPSDKVPTNALLGRQAPRTPMPGQKSTNDTGRRLNPRFVEWLMGWPEGWCDLTNSESSATE